MMNCFVALQKDDGSVELVTPPLADLILPGVTRDSVLSLARSHADPSSSFRIDGFPERLTVSERNITMSELKSAAQEGKLLECFGSGTAAIITSVSRIGYKGEDIPVPVEGQGHGPIAGKVYEYLQAIQTGDFSYSNWSVLVQ